MTSPQKFLCLLLTFIFRAPFMDFSDSVFQNKLHRETENRLPLFFSAWFQHKVRQDDDDDNGLEIQRIL